MTGQVLYVGDMHLPGMLHARGLLSSEHHARIVSIDTSRAERLPGVRGVATARDLADNVTGQIVKEQPIFADTKVRYRGEIVALVAADTEEIAHAAVELIDVKYEPLPAVFDAREAMKPDAPIIHEEGQEKLCKGNRIMVFGHDCLQQIHGDVDKGFAEADIIVEETISTSGQRSVPIEPHACLVRPEAVGGVTVWSNTQVPFMVSGTLAQALGLPLNKVRVIVPAVGGGFGQKGQMTIEPNVAALALKVRRPVRWAMSMHDNMVYGSTKAPHYMTFKLGLKRDGTLTAIHRTHISNAGAYGSTACISSGKAAMIGSGTYRIPNQSAEVWTVYTNTSQSAPFRGFGMSQPSVAIETMMDIAARRVGMDPLEFRLRNALVDGDRCGTGQVMHSVGITACLEKVKMMARWGVGTSDSR
ncbi:MAG: xanthine dehydrogenase family protein molybdopterin-binding subunit [Rhodoplanes sp.]|uniref:xanthine dehydrogenase family protein molybdopterin-binding subunit n=1 Tax=Rhodoplanes sp. TaxID=1968906 RepID=UPI0017C70A79|nr:molybdopterin cofactor-binding domain-containing protein [Rhodoplanes sp.]NVO15267.1 xanthine dehydrogenase family protein molybdopterin-binding subunit [Rhodoplanes sp.]